MMLRFERSCGLPHMVLVVLGTLAFSACVASGEWVKPGVTPDEVENALHDCRTMILQPFVDPSRKESPPPDLTMAEIEQCMRRKGFVWVPAGEAHPDAEILTVPESPASDT